MGCDHCCCKQKTGVPSLEGTEVKCIALFSTVFVFPWETFVAYRQFPVFGNKQDMCVSEVGSGWAFSNSSIFLRFQEKNISGKSVGGNFLDFILSRQLQKTPQMLQPRGLKQVRFVSVKAERSPTLCVTITSSCHVRVTWGGPLQRHVHDSTRPSRLGRARPKKQFSPSHTEPP